MDAALSLFAPNRAPAARSLRADVSRARDSGRVMMKWFRTKMTDPVATYEHTLSQLASRPALRSGRPPLVRRVVMTVISALRIDPRLEREARALVKRGFEVIIIGPDISTPR